MRALLRPLLHSPKLPFRMLGVMTLLQLGDADALETLERDAEALVGLLPQRETLLEVGASLGVYYRSPDPRGIAVLARLSSNTEAGHLSSAHTVIGHISLARDAAQSLAAIHSEDTPPILVKLLSSPDFEIRHHAVFGFASFAMNFPVQSIANVANMHNLRSLPGGKFAAEAKANMRMHGPGVDAFRVDEQAYLEF